MAASARERVRAARGTPRSHKAPARACEGPRQAAPMQKRVEPAALARTAASHTGSMSSSLEAGRPVSLRHDEDCEQ